MAENLGRSLVNMLDDSGTHHFEIAVYYEDTDAAGVVYFANYMRFMERARQEMLKAAGVSYPPFMYVNCNINFRRPARLDDLVTVRSSVREIRGAKMIMEQRILRRSDQELLIEMESTLVHVGQDFRPSRISPELCKALGSRQSGEAIVTGTVNEDRYRLPNGNILCIPPAGEPCGAITILGPDKSEVSFWESKDWATEPEKVMREILTALIPPDTKLP